MQVAILNKTQERLLEQILALTKPELPSPAAPVTLQGMAKNRMPWNVQRQMLEAEDRKTASVLAEHSRVRDNIDKLEKELGVKNAEAITGSTKEVVPADKVGDFSEGL